MSPSCCVLVGAGFVSQFWVPGLQAQSDLDVVAVVDPDAQRARHLATALGPGVANGARLADALRTYRPDVVVNLTPPSAHRTVIEAALHAGCEVITEKPLAADLADAVALVELSDHVGRPVSVMQNRRYAPAIRALRVEITEKSIGAVTQIDADMFMAPSHHAAYLGEQDHPLLTDMAIHTFDQVRFLTGREPTRLVCHDFAPASSPYPAPAAAVCTAELDDGSVFSYRGNWVAPGLPTSYDSTWRITGTTGRLVWDSWNAPIRQGADGTNTTLAAVETGEDGFTACLNAILAARRSGQPAETDGHDHLRSLAMVDAAIRSTTRRRWVAVRSGPRLTAGARSARHERSR